MAIHLFVFIFPISLKLVFFIFYAIVSLLTIPSFYLSLIHISSGMVAALVMGGVVCTALSMAGGFITDLKIGYWLGSTPAKQETWKFLGTIVSAATVGGVMIILNKTYGFTSLSLIHILQRHHIVSLLYIGAVHNGNKGL